MGNEMAKHGTIAACAICGQDIQFLFNRWVDRGGNAQCSAYKNRHGETVKPQSRHTDTEPSTRWKMPVFGACDIRAFDRPIVARIQTENGGYRFCVIGTQYGYLHTSGGDIRTWQTASGARKAAKRYIPL